MIGETVNAGLVIGLILASIVVVLILVQVQIRKQHHFDSPLPPEAVIASVSRAVGGGSAYRDATGDLSIPFNGGILSVAIEPAGAGSSLHVWLSQYNFLAANGFQVLAYRNRVAKIRNATGVV